MACEVAAAQVPAALPTVLVVGGTGYVAQFVIEALLRIGTFAVHATHRPGKEVTELPKLVTCHAADYTDAEAIAAVLRAVRPTAVVNCGAMSALGTCEKDPEGAARANCPCDLVEAIAKESGGEPRLFVHFSTDIVFDGNPEKVYNEDVRPAPLQIYGRLKAEFDDFLAAQKEPVCIVLRPTNILGPRHPYLSNGTKFLQWLDAQLRCDVPLKLFRDELRNYVWVEDLAAVVTRLIQDFPASLPLQRLLHCGGPDALSRVDVAQLLAGAKGYSLTYTGEDGQELPRIMPVPRASVDLGYVSPLCIRMSSACTEAYLGRPFRPIKECIGEAVSRI